MNILFAESSIELIPDELWNLKDVRKFVDKFFGKNRYQILLDINYFYKWFDKLKNREKRGRPDILHFCLLNSLESIANKEGLLKIYIHTINNEIIEVNPKIRLPKNYDRFKGLIAQLLHLGKVPKEGEPLMRKMNIELKEFLDKFNRKILLSEKGIYKNPMEIAKEIDENDLIIIGCFPHGDFSNIFYDYSDKIYSIYHIPLMAWVVTYKIISAYEYLKLIK